MARVGVSRSPRGRPSPRQRAERGPGDSAGDRPGLIRAAACSAGQVAGVAVAAPSMLGARIYRSGVRPVLGERRRANAPARPHSRDHMFVCDVCVCAFRVRESRSGHRKHAAAKRCVATHRVRGCAFVLRTRIPQKRQRHCRYIRAWPRVVHAPSRSCSRSAQFSMQDVSATGKMQPGWLWKTHWSWDPFCPPLRGIACDPMGNGILQHVCLQSGICSNIRLTGWSRKGCGSTPATPC